MPYRPEIDGLRAIAVLSVIFFHAGFAGFDGGFVGVDVFFVISGYLITGIILRELDEGRFSLVGFYERRARRLMPAMFVVLAACLPFAWFWMLPTQFERFSESMVSVMLFASNIFFWQESSYFAPASELTPLLHTWSLAVEEQFYLFFPLLLLMLRGSSRMRIFVVVAVGAALSFALAEYASTRHASANFYLLPTRAWELGVGALLAIAAGGERALTGWAARIASALGLAMVAGSVVLFHQGLPFPSAWTLVPVLGTALLIAAAGPETLTGRLLSLRPMVWIGLISYSTYLWHQPVFAFARIHLFDEVPDALYAVLALASLGLGYLTWVFVEQPFRRGRRILTRARVFAGTAALSGGFLAIGVVGHATDGLMLRFPKEERVALASAAHGQSEFLEGWLGEVRSGWCHLQDPGSRRHPESCLAPSEEGLFLWGDSHGAALYPGLAALPEVKADGLAQFTTAGCPPLLRVPTPRYMTNCNEINAGVLERLFEAAPEQVMMAAAWGHRDYPLEPEAMAAKLATTLAHIRAHLPETEIVVVGPGPRWPTSAWRVAALHVLHDDGVPEISWFARKLYDFDEALRAAAQRNGAEYVSLIEALCTEQGCRLSDGSDNTALYYQDYGHLTVLGSHFVARETLSAKID